MAHDYSRRWLGCFKLRLVCCSQSLHRAIGTLLIVLFLYSHESFAIDRNLGGAWDEFPRSMPHFRYEEDEAFESDHHFGVSKAFSPYADPEFEEARQLPDPLTYKGYSSYNLIVIVNKREDPFWGRQQTMRVYKRGRGLLYYWFISTGIKGFDTPSGYYRPTMFSSKHWSSIYQVPMLWAVFFHGGMALHSSIDRDSLRELGRQPSSHGCVHVEDYRAEELFHLVGHSGYGYVDAINSRFGRKSNNKVLSYKTLIIVSPVDNWLSFQRQDERGQLGRGEQTSILRKSKVRAGISPSSQSRRITRSRPLSSIARSTTPNRRSSVREYVPGHYH